MGLFIRGSRSHYNLYAHRDGAKGRAPCPRRARAIQFGLVLPNSWAQEQAENAQELTEANGQNTLDAFLSQLTFSVELCNIVLVIWILWHTLPFNRLYDFPLRAAFKLANRRADLRSPTWAAGISKELYLNLSLAVIDLVLVSLHFCFYFLNLSNQYLKLLLVVVELWKVLPGPRCLDYKG